MEPLRLFFYRQGEHYDYPADVRAALGDPVPLPLDPARAAEQGFLVEPDPRAADYLILPFRLDPLITHRRTPYARRFLEALPFFPELERRHVLFTCHDLCQPLCTCACLITDNPARSNREDPFIDSFPHAPFAHVLAAAPDFGFERIRFDVSFVGTVSDPVRLTLLESVGGRKDLRSYLSAPVAPYWERGSSYLHMKSAARRAPLERLYVGVMQRSWATLCPRGRGSSSIRFFETMCMGRLPVLVSDEYTPPLDWRIDYAAFCLRVPEAEAANAGGLVRDWLAGKSREERECMCRRAREVWERDLAPGREAALTLEILRRHLPRARAGASGPARLVRSAPGALVGEDERRVFPSGYFAGMVLDDGRSWFSGGMLAGPGPRPGTVVVDGRVGELPRGGLNLLYHAGRALPANARIADLRCGAGVSAIVLAGALLSRRDLGGRVFCLEDWDAADREDFVAAARRAGVEFLLSPLRLTGAAGLFLPASLDLVHVNRGLGPADAAPWWDALRPGGEMLLLESALTPENAPAWADFARSRGVAALRSVGFVRLRRPVAEGAVSSSERLIG